MKFLIIGGDAAGMSAASRAKRHLPKLDVIVLEKTEDVSYSACGMPYNIADSDRDIDDLLVKPPTYFAKSRGSICLPDTMKNPSMRKIGSSPERSSKTKSRSVSFMIGC